MQRHRPDYPSGSVVRPVRNRERGVLRAAVKLRPPSPPPTTGGRTNVDIAQGTVCATQFSDKVLLLREGNANARTDRVDLTLRNHTNARIHVTLPWGTNPGSSTLCAVKRGLSRPYRTGNADRARQRRTSAPGHERPWVSLPKSRPTGAKGRQRAAATRHGSGFPRSPICATVRVGRSLICAAAPTGQLG